jgi:hypothetical protein
MPEPVPSALGGKERTLRIGRTPHPAGSYMASDGLPISDLVHQVLHGRLQEHPSDRLPLAEGPVMRVQLDHSIPDWRLTFHQVIDDELKQQYISCMASILLIGRRRRARPGHWGRRRTSRCPRLKTGGAGERHAGEGCRPYLVTAHCAG